MERGQTILEMVVVLPLLTLLLWGMWELALGFGESFIAQYAAYAAARTVVVADPDTRERRAEETAYRIITTALGRLPNAPSVTIQCQREDDCFEVWVSWWRRRFWQGPRKIEASSRLQLEE